MVALIHRCCSKDPQARPTAVELVKLLRQAPATPQSSLSAGAPGSTLQPSVPGSSATASPADSGSAPWTNWHGTAAAHPPRQLAPVREDEQRDPAMVSPFAVAAAAVAAADAAQQQQPVPPPAPQPEPRVVRVHAAAPPVAASPFANAAPLPPAGPESQ